MRTPTHLLLCLFLLFCSCGKEDEENYHKFTQDDYNYIPTVYKEEGKVRNYINQHNDTIKIRSGSYTLEKAHSSDIFFGGQLYYYDRLWIRLDFLNIINADATCRYVYIKIFKQYDSALVYEIPIPGSNPCGRAPFEYVMPYNKKDLKVLTVGTKTYNDVWELKISDKSYHSDSYFTLADNVTLHTVYYSLKHGIIGFDDTKKNLTYRLKE